jgi:hypothetical protein
VGAFAYAPNEEIYVDRFNTVVVNVPATIRCEYAQEYSLIVKSEKHYLYDYTIKNDTLTINYKFQNTPHIDAEDYILTIKHPRPGKLLEELKIETRSLKMTKKSGNQKK